MHTLNVFLTNDDGIHAQGIQALRLALLKSPKVAAVYTVAPSENRSGVSSAITIDRALKLHSLVLNLDDANRINVSCRQKSAPMWSLDGTPADCVLFALAGLKNTTHTQNTNFLGLPRIDLVVSGMNNGANMADDAVFSGTLGAARVAWLEGYDAVAFSLNEKDWAHCDAAAQACVAVLSELMAAKAGTSTIEKSQPPRLWNVNLPNLPNYDSVQGVKTRLGRRAGSMPTTAKTLADGSIAYHIGEAGDIIASESPSEAAQYGRLCTDTAAVAAGCISITEISVI